MQLYSVLLIPGKAEITGDKVMYPRASGGPRPPPNLKKLLHTMHVLYKSAFCSMLWTSEFQLRFGVVDLFPFEKEYDNSLCHYDFFYIYIFYSV